MNKKDLSERDICTKFITPAIEKSGWDKLTQLLEEVSFTDGKIYVRGKMTARGARKRADYILYYKPNIPIAIVEAKDNKHSVRAGIQQALDYAKILDIPCVFSSNGDGFVFHDRTATDGNVETELGIDSFPTPEELWQKYKKYKGIETQEAEKVVAQDYYFDGSGRSPRYYQQIAVNRTVEAVAKGRDRILLVMATGTGKTYTAFQIIHRLWKSGAKKRILFLADRTALIDQTRRGDFRHFKDKMTIIKKKVVSRNDGKEELVSNKKRGIDTEDKAYEVFLGLYQGLTNAEGVEDAYKDFSPEFFDLIVIDECHRGSAKEDSAWREILTYFKKAIHIGLTATPKETDEVSNSEYFGEPLYTYSLKQGIDDGFLAPYRVVRVNLNVDAEGWRPEQGKKDKDGNEVEDRVYNRKDFDRHLVIEERTQAVARKLTEFLKGYDRFAKTIVFCTDIDHAERMRSALSNLNADLVAQNYKYIMQITGDNDEGKRELDNFINPEEPYPVIATTSELMTTGVDAQTCKVIVLDAEIKSMTKFKQIVGRGTRINEEFGKMYFTIIDFRNVTDLFADKDFDGDPIRIKPVSEETDLGGIIDEEENIDTPIFDEETGEEIEIVPEIRYPQPQTPTSKVHEPREKVYVNGVDVSILISREMYFDNNGKPITTSLKDHTKDLIKGQYASLDDFLNRWNSIDKKEVIIKELEEQGVLVEALRDAVNREVDLFDLICHVAFEQPPLTRKERANNVKKRDYFTKYGEQARKVLETLLDKYADEGVTNIESMDILKVKPLTDYGSALEIVNGIFGGKKKYVEAIKELEQELYKTGA
ncbi:MAG: restriction endonuclease [Cytophagales bacterium CG12_big_fil_rev_8_21_14_0_65_40_12]|nr:MAG: restriction endonuclease [Cytophagales bacterium CG12_big_fil_rev_8_21_14_0_65_40_12]PIW05509.1 MAG: restriction endonuclease [Cytophagales bacterium CG17_big_fil_post_rev_8_21_14_2_50_40_13]